MNNNPLNLMIHINHYNKKVIILESGFLSGYQVKRRFNIYVININIRLNKFIWKKILTKKSID